jgi:hypothetical protein
MVERLRFALGNSARCARILTLATLDRPPRQVGDRNVSYGSDSGIRLNFDQVRFSHESRHQAAIVKCHLCADFVAEVGNFSREARAAASWSKL